MLKHEIKNFLIQFFVDEEIFDSSATSQILVTQTDLQLRELEIKRQVEIEKLRLEHENRIRVENAEGEERLRHEKEEREDRIRLETLERENRLLRQKNSKFWFPEFFSSYAWHVTQKSNILQANSGNPNKTDAALGSPLFTICPTQ